MGRKTDSTSRTDTDHWQNGYDAGMIEGKIQGQIEGEDRILSSSARDARFTAAHLVFSTNTGYSDQHLKQIDALAQYLLTGHNPEAADSKPQEATPKADGSDTIKKPTTGTTEIPHLYSEKQRDEAHDDGFNTGLKYAEEAFISNIGHLAHLYENEGQDAVVEAIKTARKQARR